MSLHEPKPWKLVCHTCQHEWPEGVAFNINHASCCKEPEIHVHSLKNEDHIEAIIEISNIIHKESKGKLVLQVPIRETIGVGILNPKKIMDW